MTKNVILALFIGDSINKAVREKRGRLTSVSDQCVINRKKFAPDGIAHLDLCQAARLWFAVEDSLSKERLDQLISDIKEFRNIIKDLDDDDEPAEL